MPLPPFRPTAGRSRVRSLGEEFLAEIGGACLRLSERLSLGRSSIRPRGSPRIQLGRRRPWVLTQGLRRGAHGADEPRAIAKLAGCDSDGS